ncbi:Uncharacterised protein [uncultured archaeon]|nr:Uncharacterised protein [uncultured archaeon]
MATMKIDEKQKKIRFWIGILASIVFVMILFIPEVSPVVDNPRFFKAEPLTYLGAAGIIVGLISGNGIRGGVKAGFIGGIIALTLIITKNLIFYFTQNNSEPLDPRILLGILDLIILYAIPVAAGGATGGLMGELIKKLQH